MTTTVHHDEEPDIPALKVWDSNEHNTIGEAFVRASGSAAAPGQVTRIGEELIASAVARLHAINATRSR